MNTLNFVISITLGLASTSAYSEDRIGILCYGEHPQSNCPSNTTIFRGCNTDAKAVGREFCTMETGNGQIVVPHFVDFISQKSGHRCGYNWFKITCKSDALRQVDTNNTDKKGKKVILAKNNPKL